MQSVASKHDHNNNTDSNERDRKVEGSTSYSSKVLKLLFSYDEKYPTKATQGNHCQNSNNQSVNVHSRPPKVSEWKQSTRFALLQLGLQYLIRIPFVKLHMILKNCKPHFCA